jgi:hypothetical protein
VIVDVQLVPRRARGEQASNHLDVAALARQHQRRDALAVLAETGAEKGEGGVSGPSVGSASVATRATADGGVRARHARVGGGARGAA